MTVLKAVLKTPVVLLPVAQAVRLEVMGNLVLKVARQVAAAVHPVTTSTNNKAIPVAVPINRLV